MSLLPEQIPDQQYGFFGYKGAMCDRAISRDNPDMLKECVERDFIDAHSEMLQGGHGARLLPQGRAEMRGNA